MQAHARSVLRVFDLQVLELSFWKNMPPLLSWAMSCVHFGWKLLSFLLISSFPKAWTKRTENKKLLHLWKAGIFWLLFPSSRLLCLLPFRVYVTTSSMRLPGAELTPMLQISSSEFSRWIFLKWVCSKVGTFILSKSNDTQICILNINCCANCISTGFLHRNVEVSGKMQHRLWQLIFY